MARTTTLLTESSPATPERHTRPRTILVALAVAAPLCDALASALHPDMPDDPYALLAVVDATPRWYATTLVGLLACALLGVAYLTLARRVRWGAPRLATCGLVLGAAGIVLMSAMHGFKLFLPTLADVTLDDGSTAVGDYIESTAFIPMIAGFITRALAWIVLAIALVTTTAVRWWVGALMAAGAVVAFQLPAGPDAVGWVAVAAGTYLALHTRPSTAAMQSDQGAEGSPH